MIGTSKSSIICENGSGWLIDHMTFLDHANDAYCYWPNKRLGAIHSIGKHRSDSYVVKRCLYAIYHPFKMDSQFAKFVESHKIDTLNRVAQSHSQYSCKRKRKNALVLQHESNENLPSHILKCYLSLKDASMKHEYFTRSCDLPLNNNIAARQAAKACDDIPLMDLLSNECVSRDTDTIHRLTDAETNVTIADVANRLIHVNTPTSDISAMILDGETYLLPNNSKFLWSDIQHIHKLMQDEEKYDLIVIDPPWQNKSVKRKKSYWSLDVSDLLGIPVPGLAKPGAILVLWVTNRGAHRDFVIDELFPHWSIEHIATWHWLKVTRGGELVTDIHSEQKKPYEAILIGQYCPATTDVQKFDFPDNRVVMSVPSSIHSQKPCLIDILRPYLPDTSNKLELFARNLLPGWTSWGNEVFKHQHISLFEESQPTSSEHTQPADCAS